MEDKVMRKIVMIILTAGLLLGTAACQAKEDKPTPPLTPEAAESPSTSETKQGEEKTITGKISDIKNVMFILDDGKEAYVFDQFTFSTLIVVNSVSPVTLNSPVYVT